MSQLLFSQVLTCQDFSPFFENWMTNEKVFCDFLSISLCVRQTFSLFMKCRKKSKLNNFKFIFKDIFLLSRDSVFAGRNDKSTSYSKPIYFYRMVPDNYCCKNWKFPWRAVAGIYLQLHSTFKRTAEMHFYDHFCCFTWETPLVDRCCFEIYQTKILSNR